MFWANERNTVFVVVWDVRRSDSESHLVRRRPELKRVAVSDIDDVIPHMRRRAGSRPSTRRVAASPLRTSLWWAHTSTEPRSTTITTWSSTSTPRSTLPSALPPQSGTYLAFPLLTVRLPLDRTQTDLNLSFRRLDDSCVRDDDSTAELRDKIKQIASQEIRYQHRPLASRHLMRRPLTTMPQGQRGGTPVLPPDREDDRPTDRRVARVDPERRQRWPRAPGTISLFIYILSFIIFIFSFINLALLT
jgi:hypothetical protein